MNPHPNSFTVAMQLFTHKPLSKQRLGKCFLESQIEQALHLASTQILVFIDICENK